MIVQEWSDLAETVPSKADGKTCFVLSLVRVRNSDTPREKALVAFHRTLSLLTVGAVGEKI